jgi:acylphosphatase
MRIHFRARGEVQGVGYRRFAVHEAQALGLAGWVRNEADGSVSGEAEGPEASLMVFQSHLAQGPTFAHVGQLDWRASDMRSSLPHPFAIHR